jgi:phosphohistidine phosphatase
MKHLYICRHAKSDRNIPNIPDFDRPLSERGLNDAPLMGDFLKSKNIAFDQIISSTALRAMSTALIFAEKTGFAKENIQSETSIYGADIPEIISLLKNIPDSCNNVAIFGHNPTFTYLIEYLAEYEIDNLPTCGVACIELDTDHWNMIDFQGNRVNFVVFPKMLR